jgi:ribonucleoside-diphosphate reductase alpha chain
MIELDKEEAFVKELVEVKAPEVIKAKKEERPYMLDAKIYKLKSAFVNYAIYISLSYTIDENGRKRPFEIFINSKDLTKAAEYSMLTRLISAIFRRSEDPTFILEELKSIYDPNGGYYKNGKYIPSIYAEIADVLEQFFYDIGILKRKEEKAEIKQAQLPMLFLSDENGSSKRIERLSDDNLKLCPKCNQKTLKLEAGCETCINPDCNYSKCA